MNYFTIFQVILTAKKKEFKKNDLIEANELDI